MEFERLNFVQSKLRYSLAVITFTPIYLQECLIISCLPQTNLTQTQVLTFYTRISIWCSTQLCTQKIPFRILISVPTKFISSRKNRTNHFKGAFEFVQQNTSCLKLPTIHRFCRYVYARVCMRTADSTCAFVSVYLCVCVFCPDENHETVMSLYF